MQSPDSVASVDFRWDAPARDCPAEERVRERLEHLLGHPLAQSPAPRVTAIARVRQERDGSWDLRLWTVASSGPARHRGVRADECETLAEAAAVLTAMAIDPSRTDGLPTGTAVTQALAETRELDIDAADDGDGGAGDLQEVSDSAARNARERTRRSPTRPAADRPAEVRTGSRARRETSGRARPLPSGAVFLLGGGSYGDLPRFGPSFRLGAAIRWRRARLELGTSYGVLRRVRMNNPEPAGGDLHFASASLHGCPVWSFQTRRGPIELPPCLGVELGSVFGRGHGLDRSKHDAAFWGAVTLLAQLRYAPVPRVAIGFAVEPFVAFARPPIDIGGVGTIYRPLPAGVRAWLAFEVRFGPDVGRRTQPPSSEPTDLATRGHESD
jgi:hypothetical protein